MIFTLFSTNILISKADSVYSKFSIIKFPFCNKNCRLFITNASQNGVIFTIENLLDIRPTNLIKTSFF